MSFPPSSRERDPISSNLLEKSLSHPASSSPPPQPQDTELAPPSLSSEPTSTQPTSPPPTLSSSASAGGKTTHQTHDPISTHVLDLTTGRPAPNIPVSLYLLTDYGPSVPFTGLTDPNGRVSSWTAPDGPSLREIFINNAEQLDKKMVWGLKFETGKYWGGETLFPEVEIRFFVDAREGRYHVPMLLGPWSYTVYRGS